MSDLTQQKDVVQSKIKDCTMCSNISGVLCGNSPEIYTGTEPIKAMIIGHSPKTRTESKANTVLNMNEKISLIGICSCGTVKDGAIVKADNLGIYNFNIVKILREELKYSEKINTPIILRNDAKCAAIA
jgi:predicted NBD/HSP70 family sugar kinase